MTFIPNLDPKTLNSIVPDMGPPPPLACEACRGEDLESYFGVLKCRDCGHFQDDPAVELPPVHQEIQPVDEPDPLYILGITDRWYELDMRASLSFPLRFLVWLTGISSFFAFLGGIWFVGILLSYWMIADTAQSRLMLSFATYFSFAMFFAWLGCLHFGAVARRENY